ncbi:MAG: protein-glutamate O-methyltransferase [Proteobacteria bacterium]|nr:protein-glutamate O-methyltransferase [Pseudomonadota bacterium]MBU0964945.1 protein-glutamate O-methyltransferase [Pseudomonadota bacterium]
MFAGTSIKSTPTDPNTDEFAPLLADKEFRRLSSLIYDIWGIHLPPAKKTMVSSRLRKRLKALRHPSFKAYIDYVMSPAGRHNEWSHLIDAVSTNKTDFFREKIHFDFLSRNMLPRMAAALRKSAGRILRVWSAGCSSGEEPYTMAMVLTEYQNQNPWFSFAVTATDINNQVLDEAIRGIYDDETLTPVPKFLLYKYFMKGKGNLAGYHRVVPELRQRICFQRVNLMERSFGFKSPFDIIFCRNVIIYFDQQTQRQLFHKFYSNLTPNGFLFLGHSENLHGMDDKFVKVESSVYQCKK